MCVLDENSEHAAGGANSEGCAFESTGYVFRPSKRSERVVIIFLLATVANVRDRVILCGTCDLLHHRRNSCEEARRDARFTRNAN